MEQAGQACSAEMMGNLFYGDIFADSFPNTNTMNESIQGHNNSYYWITTRLIRDYGPLRAETIKSPEDVASIIDLLQEHLDIENCDREHFIALYLNRKGTINAAHVVSIGGLSSASAHPREVFKPAILTSSASVVLVHNHPSGDPSPSSEDIELTRRMIEAGNIIGIEVLDHVIIGSAGDFYSFKGHGLI